MASKWTWLAGVTLALGALQGGGEASADTTSSCVGQGRSAPLRPPQLLTPSDVKSAAEYAYAQNRRLVFREAADAYQDLAAIADDNLVTPEQRFEGALFSAVNLSNQDRSTEAMARLKTLESDPIAVNDPFRGAQILFFSALVTAQQGKPADALVGLERLYQKLSEIGLSSTTDAIAHPNGDVEITRVGALRVTRSSADAQSSRAFGSILGQRSMTPVEKVAILKTHAHYLGSVVHQSLAVEATEAEGKTREEGLARGQMQLAIESAAVFGPQYAPWLRAKAAARAAELRVEADDLAGARRIADQALEVYLTYGNGGPLEAELRRVLADINRREGNFDGALQQEREAFCVRAAGADLAPLETEEVLPLLSLLLRGKETADDTQTVQEFLRVGAAAMEGDTARIVSQSAHLMSQRAEQQPEIREAILAEIDQARLKERLAGLLNEGRSASDQDVRLTREQIAEIGARLQAIYSRGVPENLSRENAAVRAKAAGFLPGQAAVADAANADLSALQSVLQPDELYVRFVITADAAYGIGVTATQARAYRIGDAVGLQKRLQVIQEGVLFGLRRDKPERMLDVLDEAQAAYQDLFGPVDDLAQGAKRLILDATGAAANVPFSLLVARPLTEQEMAGVTARVRASRGRDFTGIPWLGRDRSISMVASAVSFKAQRDDAAGSTAANPILAFASPPLPNEAERPQFSSALVNIVQSARKRYGRPECKEELQEIYGYAGLPGSYESAVTASRLLAGGDSGYRIVSGQDFTDRNVRKFDDFSAQAGQAVGLDDYRVLYFGSHGQHPGANQCVQEPLLVTTTPTADSIALDTAGDQALGDGMLDTSEIQRLSLNADLIVLAACETVGMRRIKEGASITNEEAARSTRLTGLSGGGVIGNFAGSFFVAGARAVLATYWAVENTATNRFMEKFFQTAAAGASKADAVQAAQRGLMDDPEYSNPIFWAPFVFIGDGAKALKVGTIAAAPPAAPNT